MRDNRAEALPRVWKASEMAPSRPVEWLARHRVPRGAVTVLVGEEGIGKSLLWVWLTAAMTTGREVPEYGIRPGQSQHVVLLLAENGFSDMDRPRLEAAGADLDYVHVIAVGADGTGAPAFTGHTQGLLDSLDFAPALIVADPWLDTVPGNFTVKDGQQAKQAIRPWRETAVRHNAAVLLIAHTNRTASANARDKYGATSELRKTARMTLFAQIDDETGLLSIGPEKSNLVPRGLKASEFRIETQGRDGWEEGVPVLAYVGEAHLTAAELVSEKFDNDRDGGNDDRTDCEMWLSDYLTEHGPARRKKVLDDARKAGFTVARTVQRAFNRIGGVAGYTATVPREAEWSLPDSGDTGDSLSLTRVPTAPTGVEQRKHKFPTEDETQ